MTVSARASVLSFARSWMPPSRESRTIHSPIRSATGEPAVLFYDDSPTFSGTGRSRVSWLSWPAFTEGAVPVRSALGFVVTANCRLAGRYEEDDAVGDGVALAFSAGVAALFESLAAAVLSVPGDLSAVPEVAFFSVSTAFFRDSDG